MENKYYTPDISEFHIGFEYEMTDGYSYTKQIFPNPWFNGSDMGGFNTLKNCLIGSNIRVKYLDKEDIESLGFEESPDEPDEWVWKFKGDISTQLYYDDKTRNTGDGIGITIYNVTGIIFSGYIKNKSELKRILKMIGYENSYR